MLLRHDDSQMKKLSQEDQQSAFTYKCLVFLVYIAHHMDRELSLKGSGGCHGMETCGCSSKNTEDGRLLACKI